MIPQRILRGCFKVRDCDRFILRFQYVEQLAFLKFHPQFVPCSLLLLHICKTPTGLHDTDNKKEHQQGVTDSLQCSVDIDDD